MKKLKVMAKIAVKKLKKELEETAKNINCVKTR